MEKIKSLETETDKQKMQETIEVVARLCNPPLSKQDLKDYYE